VLGQNILVINCFPTIFNRCRRSNWGRCRPSWARKPCFWVEFYPSVLGSL